MFLSIFCRLDVFEAMSSFNSENKDRVGEFLFNQFKENKDPKDISKFLLQLMVSMFNLEDKVGLCLHTKPHAIKAEEMLNTSTGKTSRTSVIDSNVIALYLIHVFRNTLGSGES